MDQNQIRLVIEDMLRADIARDINITHRSVGFSNGSKTVTEWKQVINFNYQPKFYRLALIKHFFFELRIINTNKINALTKKVQTDLPNIRRIPPLDLARSMYRVPTVITPEVFWDNVFHALFEIINDNEWWSVLEERVKCTNNK